jgi:hypothetical protein
MIPARIHRIWLGSPLPEEHARIWDAWRRLFPDHELHTWREDDLERLGLPPAFYAAETYAGRSDVARLRVLDVLGGIYADCDVEPLRRFDDLWTSTDELVVFEQQPGLVLNGLIAAAPGALSFVAALVERSARRGGAGAPVVRTGPFALTAAVQYHLSRDPSGVRIYPPSFVDLDGGAAHAVARTRLRVPPDWTTVADASRPRRSPAGSSLALEARILPLRARRRLRAALRRMRRGRSGA